MDLILWRHAEAVEAQGDMSDDDRPLTPKGLRQAQRMAHWLNQHIPESTRVLVSPALRTQQTAEALKRKMRTLPALGTEASVEALLHAARWPDSREPVLVIGHQPTLGMAAAYLVAGAALPWTLRKGGIWWLRQRQRVDRDEVIVQTVLGPDQV
jgi:phosphohistidine phosphatase